MIISALLLYLIPFLVQNNRATVLVAFRPERIKEPLLIRHKLLALAHYQRNENFDKLKSALPERHNYEYFWTRQALIPVLHIRVICLALLYLIVMSDHPASGPLIIIVIDKNCSADIQTPHRAN